MSTTPTTPNPYRSLPVEQEYAPPSECAVCEWCRFEGPTVKYDYDLQDPRNLWTLRWRQYQSCMHPAQRHSIRHQSANRPGRQDDWNQDGACSGYTITVWTRFLRFFGLRKPIWLR